MIRSMTGFGRADFEAEGVAFEVELRCFNHRFLDLRVRLPRPLVALEFEVRASVQKRLDRGRVDASVQTLSGVTPPPRLELNWQALQQYAEAAKELQQRFGFTDTPNAVALLALPGAVQQSDASFSSERVREGLLAALERALDAVDAMRLREGEALEREFRARLARVAELASVLEGRGSFVQESARERLHKRAQQLCEETGLRDDARLYQEIALAADRLDIAEEVARLRSHVAQFEEMLAAAGPGKPAGRRLDFLLQELGRETNTIGSKISDAESAHLVIELKSELERLREQVQNVE